MAHTPTPWGMLRSLQPHDGQYDYCISATDAPVLAETFGRSSSGVVLPADENAKFLLRAVNAYEANEALIKELVEALKLAADRLYEEGARHVYVDDAREVVAKAEAR